MSTGLSGWKAHHLWIHHVSSLHWGYPLPGSLIRGHTSLFLFPSAPSSFSAPFSELGWGASAWSPSVSHYHEPLFATIKGPLVPNPPALLNCFQLGTHTSWKLCTWVLPLRSGLSEGGKYLGHNGSSSGMTPPTVCSCPTGSWNWRARELGRSIASRNLFLQAS